MVNGYQVIDLGGKDIPANTPSQFKVLGIHDKIEATNKPLLIGGYSIGQVEARPCFSQLNLQSNGGYQFVLNTGINPAQVTLAIGSDDIVHVTFGG